MYYLRRLFIVPALAAQDLAAGWQSLSKHCTVMQCVSVSVKFVLTPIPWAADPLCVCAAACRPCGGQGGECFERPAAATTFGHQPVGSVASGAVVSSYWQP